MSVFRCKVYLNGTIRRHFLEDAEAVAVYSVHPAEPDVGYPNEHVDIDWIESVSGRPLGHITREMPENMWNDIVDQIIDLRMGE